jgi:hypothetical protein
MSYWNSGIGVKKYRDLITSVRRAIAGHGQTNVIMYRYAIARFPPANVVKLSLLKPIKMYYGPGIINFCNIY